MKTKTKAMILAGVFAMTATFPVTALARRGGAAGSKGMQVQTQRNDSQARQQLRLRDGSCVNRTGVAYQGQPQRKERKNVQTRQQRRLQDGSGVVPVE